MSSLSDAKVLGGIGSLLALLIAVPAVGWLIGIAGLVMVLVAIGKISHEVGEKKIYKDMQAAVVTAIGAVAVAAIIAVGAFYMVFGGFHFFPQYFGSFASQRFSWAANANHPSLAMIPHPFTAAINPFSGLGIVIISGLLVIWALLVVAAVFVRRSYHETALKLHVSMFDTAGLLLLIGVATAIIGIGLVLVIVAEIMLAISFFSIREPLQTSMPPASTS